MMNTLLKGLTALFIYGLMISNAEAVQWTTNYDEALQSAKSQNKPIVMLFTGSDWCTYCKKLEREALDTPEFSQAAGSDFVFLKLDYPMRTKLDEKTTKQNQELKTRFDIRGYPTVLIIDANQNKIASTGYKPGGGKRYAEHLKGIANGQ